MAKGTKVKTKVGELRYVFITGEGRNNAQKGAEPKFQFVASLLVDKDGAVHKDFQGQIDAEWARYKAEYGVKGLPKSTGMKDEMVKDPSGVIDPATEEVRKIPSGKVLITFKTNIKWPDGGDQVIKVFDGKGTDITKAVHAADWSIGNGSTGILHGTAMGNNVGGDHKVTLYLSAVQIAKLVKYEGTEVDAEDIGGEDIDLGDAVSSISEDSQTPDL